MSIESTDEVSTENLGSENVDKKEIQEQDTKEKEEKETKTTSTITATMATTATTATSTTTTDLEKLEAVLSVLVENKVTSIRNCEKNIKEKNHLFHIFRGKLTEANKSQSESKIPKIRTNSSTTLVSSACKSDRHKSRCKSLVPCDSATDYYQNHQTFAKYHQTSIESSHHHLHHHHNHHQLYPQQAFGSYDPSIFYKTDEDLCCGRETELDQKIADRRKFSVQKCLPKQLSTEKWLNSTTSRQTSTETATTSSGYISPTFGTEHRKHHRSTLTDTEVHSQHYHHHHHHHHHYHSMHDSTDVASNGDSETIIDMSKAQAQKTLDAIEESKSIDEMLLDQQGFVASANELEHLKVNNNSNLRADGNKCNESCHVLLPQCLSTTCLPTCKCSSGDDQGCQGGASYRHLHPSGGHYMSCYNSPTHSFQKFQYDENYLTLVMNLEDLEFEQEEERRKRRKKRKKRRKERQIRARGLMADELKSVKKASRVLDPEDLPKRARWTIVATACLLLLMSMLLVGVTLRMAPIIDEMVRKENEEMLHSLSRQGAIKEISTTTATAFIPVLNATRTLPTTLGNSSNRLWQHN